MIEFRRYTIKDGETKHFAQYFEGFFPEAFQQLGAIAFGQFFERHDPSRFTWISGFKNMESRAIGNAEFYDGPLWKEHRQTMNDLMVNFDNVLLLRPLNSEKEVPVLPAVDPVTEKHGAQGVLNVERSENGRNEVPGNLDSPNRSSLIRAADLWTYVESEPIVAELLEASELLEILPHGKAITMNAFGSPDVVFTRTVYTGGRSSEQSFWSGNLTISRARWNDEKLIIESETISAIHTTETYELNADASLLTILVRIENFLWDQPLLLQRVYDRVR